MVRNGLRAELAAANLFPGALAVALEMRPEAAPAQLQQGEGGVPEIPTAGVPMEPLAVQVGQVVKRFVGPAAGAGRRRLDSLIAAARRIVEDPALPRLLSNLARASEALAPAARQVDPTLRAATKMAEQARASLAEMQELLDRSRPLPKELERMLEQLTAPARSLRVLTEMLERHPEAILRGRRGAADARKGNPGQLHASRALPVEKAGLLGRAVARPWVEDSLGKG